MVQTNLEVGYGMAKGKDALAVGKKAARQALEAIKEHPLSLVQVFASPHYDPEALLRGIRQVVGPAPLIGASAAGEICNGVQRQAVVVLALASPYLQVKVAVGRGVSQDWQRAVIEAITAPEIAPYFSGPENVIGSLLSRQGESAFALLFSPGATRTADSRSFQILETLKRLSQGRLPIMGGNAADDWLLESNYVFWGAEVYHDSILVAVVETSLTYGISLAHGFQPTSQRTTVTLARGQEVLELDGQPAADVYSRMVQLPREDLAGKHLTLTTGRPLGILDPYGQYSINVATFFTESGGVRFTQPAPEGTCLTFMSADHDHLVAAGGEALRKALLRGSIKDPAVALVFSCALRGRILGSRLGEEISGMLDLAPQVPMVGFYSFGEQGLADDGVNRHNNEVIAVLVLGRDLSQAAQTALENESLRVDLRRQDIVIDINKRLAVSAKNYELWSRPRLWPSTFWTRNAGCRSGTRRRNASLAGPRPRRWAARCLRFTQTNRMRFGKPAGGSCRASPFPGWRCSAPQGRLRPGWQDLCRPAARPPGADQWHHDLKRGHH